GPARGRGWSGSLRCCRGRTWGNGARARRWRPLRHCPSAGRGRSRRSRRRTVLRLPVLAHELAGPRRLEDGAPGGELDDVGLDVEHRGPVDGVESPHPELEAVDLDELAHADTDAVGPGLRPLGEDADLRP